MEHFKHQIEQMVKYHISISTSNDADFTFQTSNGTFPTLMSQHHSLPNDHIARNQSSECVSRKKSAEFGIKNTSSQLKDFVGLVIRYSIRLNLSRYISI